MSAELELGGTGVCAGGVLVVELPKKPGLVADRDVLSLISDGPAGDGGAAGESARWARTGWCSSPCLPSHAGESGGFVEGIGVVA